MEVSGKPVFVYMATINRSAPGHGIVSETVGFASFDFSGDARVKVTAKQDFGPKGVQIHPQSFGIRPTVEGKTVTFSLSQPRKLCLEFNGSDRRPLFLFANNVESYPGGLPRPNQEQVRYFGPGVHQAGEIRAEAAR